MSDICVIGASSFTGKRFCELTRERGHKVWKFSLREDHITDIGWLAPKYIVNFSALNVVAPSWDHAEDYFRVNVGKVAVLAKVLRDVPLTKYVHVSTPEVYGSHEGRIFEHYIHNPSTPYAVSRSAAENLLMCEYEQYGLPVTFTRACNVYGPGQQLHRLIPKVLWCIKKGVKFPLEGGGTSKRAFCYVDDVCEATRLVMVKGQPGEAYNIFGEYDINTDHGPMYRIRDVVGICTSVAGTIAQGWDDPLDCFVEHKPARTGQDAAYELDDAKIRAHLGWAPTVELRKGIERTWQWLNDNWDTLKDAPTEYEFRP